jgi:hypothetical protein
VYQNQNNNKGMSKAGLRKFSAFIAKSINAEPPSFVDAPKDRSPKTNATPFI